MAIFADMVCEALRCSHGELMQSLPKFPQTGGNIMEHSRGIHESLRSSLQYLNATDRAHQFRRVQFGFYLVDQTNIAVMAGRRVRDAMGSEHTILMTTDGGTSGSPDDVKTLTMVGGPSNGTHWIVLRIDNSGTNNNALNPNRAQAEDNGIGGYPIDNAPDDESELIVLGWVEVAANIITDYHSYDIGEDYRDFFLIPDGNSPSATAPVLSTVQYNPTVGDHFGELEITNAHSTVSGTGIPMDEYRIPYLYKISGAPDAGEVKWYAIDADFGGAPHSGANGQKSLEFRLDGSTWLEQIYNFDDAATDTGVPEDNTWMIVMRDPTGPIVNYLDRANFADYIEGALVIDGSQIVVDTLHHHDLLGLDPDDDHGQYLLLSGDETRNSMGLGSVIGDHLNTKSIDADTRVLYDGSENLVASWQVLTLYDTSFKKAAAWGSRVLYDTLGTTADIVVNWNTQALQKTWTVKSAAGVDAYSATFADNGNNIAGTFFGATTPIFFKAGLETEAATAGDGVRGAEICNGTYSFEAIAGDINIPTAKGYYVNGIEIVTDQQPAIADIADNTGIAEDGVCRAKVDAILDMLRAGHHLIDT